MIDICMYKLALLRLNCCNYRHYLNILNVASLCLEVGKPYIFAAKASQFLHTFLGSGPLARRSVGIAQNPYVPGTVCP